MTSYYKTSTSSTKRYGVNSLPSLQVNGHTVPRGSVRAEAQAPSGRILDVDVIEKEDGTYSANFTPTESGDWLVSIMHGRQHVQGSPFSVRVFEPAAPSVRVFGLDTIQRVSGKLANFSIDTQGSGSGKLTVDVIYDGRSIPAKIDPEGQGRYHVSFTPIGSGVYTIRVYFAGIEVSGSPYSMEIVDSSEVEASGDGLTTAEVNRRATFYVDLGRTGSSRDLKVHIRSPRGMNVPASVYEGHGNSTVEFVPTEVGEHYIEVTYFNKPIASSPFRCQVFDWSRIIVSNLPTSSMIEQVVDFEIDASQAGSGSLEIIVNDGNVPCKVQPLGNRQYHASFTPLDPISHVVRVTFNGFAVPGSPWRVDIRNPANVTINGNGLHQMSVGKVAMFEVLTSEPDVDIVVNVTPPSRRTTRANVMNMRNGKYQVEYMPMEVGSHLIEVICDGVLAGGSPYASRAYNISAIAISPVNIGVVGMPVEFSIDVSQAGEGQLEISVNRGMVPNSVRSLGKGLFTVSFIPRDARPHNVDILFNGEPIPQGTITIPIMPGTGGNATTIHQQDSSMQFNQMGGFNIRPPAMILESELVVRVTSPTGELVPAKMVLQPDGDYKVEYSSRFTGRHTVEILHNGQPFMGSPFFVEIYDPNKITVKGTKTGHVNERMEFDIIRNQAGKAELKLTITGPRGNTVPFQINATAAGDNVVYTPREPGQYLIYITYGGLDVPGCPIRQDIYDDALSTAYGDGLAKAFVNQQAVFYVDCRGQQGDLDVQVDGPNSIAKRSIEPDSAGRYKVYYTPIEVGIYTVTVKYNGREIEGSPFHPKVTDPRKVRIIGSWESLVDANNRLRLTLNELKTIEFDTREAGPGVLIAELRNSTGPVPVEVIQRDRDLYAVSFVPDAFDEYVLKVLWSGSLVSRFPLIGTVTRSTVAAAAGGSTVRHGVEEQSTSMTETITKAVLDVLDARSQVTGIDSQVVFDDDKVVLTGSGLQTARVNEHAEFIIDGTNAGPGSPSVQLKNTMGNVNIDCSLISNNKYRCIYIPRTPGAYLLYITWAKRQVIGSPFKVTVLPAGEVKVVSGGLASSASIDDVDTVHVKTKSSTLHTTQSSNVSNTVSGSAASRVICSGPGLKSCIKGQEAYVTIDTNRAGLGQIQAQCVGLNRAAQCKLIQREPDLYTLLIRPVETGRHLLTITFNEEHVTGSPFVVKVSGPPDPSKVAVSGPGVSDGIITNYVGQFTVNTQGAGAGELTVKVRGPRDAFLVEMERASHKDRTILCRYNPAEPGFYTIEVKWSGEHVPRSPIRVFIAENYAELQRQFDTQRSATSLYRQSGPNATNGAIFYPDDPY